MQYVKGSNTYTYTYNDEGIRTSKTINGVRHDYLLDGTRIIKETVSDANGEQYTMIYLYDENGAPVGMKYRTPSYAEGVFDCFFFEKNLQGDVVAVYDDAGNLLIEYFYSAWSVCATYTVEGAFSSPAYKNPFKYRGYYHDSETGWYYLQSRYYNPTWGRFINADGYVSTGTGLLGYNMFAYCNNNPVMYLDFNGAEAISILLGTTLAIAFVVMCMAIAPVALEGAQIVVEGIAEDINKAVDSLDKAIKRLNEEHPGEYTVYLLKDSEGTIQYVGRTKDLGRRLQTHSGSTKTGNLELAYYLPGLSWCEARGLEEELMIDCHTYNAAKDMKERGRNWIHGVAPNNPNQAAYKLASNYIYNRVTDDIYNLIGR